MTKVDGANLVVVDGSNIATEGRSLPSLAQLNEAVISFTDEHPDVTVTVVVDATFGHRIDKSEVASFDEAVAHNELVAPPAGAIGRGDAFVLSIANKVGARILSNDSFQEFHGQYPWLFDEGRLIGGKPVPYVGWVFVPRVPVKGPISRKARSGSSGPGGATNRRTASKLASLPMPVPTAPPPRPASTAAASVELTEPTVASGPADGSRDRAAGGSRRRGRGRGAGATEVTEPAAPVADAPEARTGRSRRGRGGASASDAPTDAAPPAAAMPSSGPVNDFGPFVEFVQHHPVGSTVNGVVESYSSHGAYVTIGDLRGYVPLRLLGNPAPRSAREVLTLGDTVSLTVVNIAAARRSVDLRPAPAGQEMSTGDSGRGRTKSRTETSADVPAEKAAPARKRAPAKQAAPAAKAAANPAKTPARKTAAKTAAKTPAKKAPAKKAPAKRAPAEKAPAEKAPAKETAAKETAAKETAARKTAAKKAEGPAAPAAAGRAKKVAPAPAKEAVAKTAARKSVAKKSAAAAEIPARETARGRTKSPVEMVSPRGKKG